MQINTKPDVFIASEGHLVDITNHYNREHRIYTLMKWILRVYRRDPQRTDPLLMVDAGKVYPPVMKRKGWLSLLLTRAMD